MVTYSVILHLMVFWVIARWGHGPTHHLGDSELQLLCARHVSPLTRPSIGKHITAEAIMHEVVSAMKERNVLCSDC